jgi:hypothetical protein
LLLFVQVYKYLIFVVIVSPGRLNNSNYQKYFSLSLSPNDVGVLLSEKKKRRESPKTDNIYVTSNKATNKREV